MGASARVWLLSACCFVTHMNNMDCNAKGNG